MKITIEKVENGFIITRPNENKGYENIESGIIEYAEKKLVFGGQEDDIEDKFAAYGQEMFWELLDLLGLRGDRHQRDRLQIVTVVGDKYEPKKDEELVALDLECVRKKK